MAQRSKIYQLLAILVSGYFGLFMLLLTKDMMTTATLVRPSTENVSATLLIITFQAEKPNYLWFQV